MIDLESFCALYGCTKNNFYVMKHKYKYPEKAVIKKGMKLYINSSYFLRRQAFKQQMYDKAINNYALLEKLYTQSDLARECAKRTGCTFASWKTWICHEMWTVPQNSILNNQVSKYLVTFVRYTNALIRKHNVKSNI